MSSNEIEKFFKEVPNQAAKPIPEKEKAPVTYEEATAVIKNILSRDPDLYNYYKSGNIFNNKLDNGTDVLSVIISCYVNSLRNNIDTDKHSPEEVQQLNVTLTSFQTIFEDVLDLLKQSNFNLDVNSASAIIYGIIEHQLKEHINNDR